MVSSGKLCNSYELKKTNNEKEKQEYNDES